MSASSSHALRCFSNLVRGARPSERTNWIAVLTLANQSFTTPMLAAAAARAPTDPAWPEEVRRFLQEVAVRTTKRNARLRRQLVEASRALNCAGITPTILKGGATLLEPRPQSERLLTDLDLMVGPHQVSTALSTLASLGYEVVDAPTDQARHVVAELARPDDAGALDLHRRPPAPLALMDAKALLRGARTLDWNGARVQTPAPAAALLALVWHDQFHDGDHWHGWLDLRHLADIAALAEAPDMDWTVVASGARDRLTQTALTSHLLAARELFGAAIPAELTRGAWPALQHRRRLLQARAPGLAPLLTGACLLAEGPAVLRHFAGRASSRGEARVSPGERLANLMRAPNPGKI